MLPFGAMIALAGQRGDEEEPVCLLLPAPPRPSPHHPHQSTPKSTRYTPFRVCSSHGSFNPRIAAGALPED